MHGAAQRFLTHRQQLDMIRREHLEPVIRARGWVESWRENNSSGYASRLGFTKSMPSGEEELVLYESCPGALGHRPETWVVIEILLRVEGPAAVAEVWDNATKGDQSHEPG